MKLRRLHSLLLPVLALCLCNPLARAGVVLYSNLGPPGDIYDTGGLWTVCNSTVCGLSSTIASEFSVAGSGIEPVSEIDLAVSYAISPDSFYASIWTDVDDQPGSEVTNAYWSPSPSTEPEIGTCCDLISITGITGVTLNGGEEYFMILGPLGTSDTDYLGWNWNNQGAGGPGLVLSSTDGGTSWTDANNGVGSDTLGAFDVVGTASGTPEPGSLLLFGTGLIGLLGACRRKTIRSGLI